MNPIEFNTYVTRMIYPSTEVEWRPNAVIIVPLTTYHYGLAASPIIHFPTNAPIIFTNPCFLLAETVSEIIRFVGNMNTRHAMRMYGLSEEAINLIINVIPAMGALSYGSYESTLAGEYNLDFLNLYQIPGGMVNLPLEFYKSLTSLNSEEYPDISQNALGNVNWKGGYAVWGIYKSDTDGKVAS